MSAVGHFRHTWVIHRRHGVSPHRPGHLQCRGRAESRDSRADHRRQQSSEQLDQPRQHRRGATCFSKDVVKIDRRADGGDSLVPPPRLGCGYASGPDRRPRHRARQAEGGARSWRGPAAILQGLGRLLSRTGEDARGLCLRLLSRPTHHAGRMDAYVDDFQAAGGAWSCWRRATARRRVTAACKKHGGFYLGSIGGPAARLAQDCIRKVEVRIPGARHGGDLADRDRGLPRLHRRR